MPRNIIGQVPFPPLIVVNTDNPLKLEEIDAMLVERPTGVSICIRSQDGHPNRGGYFFHFSKDFELGEITLFDFEGRSLHTFIPASFSNFVNHCTGNVFDDEAFRLCQAKINFRQDD